MSACCKPQSATLPAPAADKAAGAASTSPFTLALQAACELTAPPFSGAAPMSVRMPGVTPTATACPEKLA